MRRDPKAFRERFAAWKNGEQVYDAGRIISYAEGKDAEYWDAVRDFISQYEGFKDTTYLDGKGIPTIGYGFTDSTLTKRGKISRAEADKYLIERLRKEDQALRDTLSNWDELGTDAKKALISYRYNYPAGFKDTTNFMKYWNAGDYMNAIKEVDAGWNDTANPGLRTRRMAEQELLRADPFLSGNANVNIPIETPADPVFNKPAPLLDFTAPRLSTDVNQPFRTVSADRKIDNSAGWKAISHLQTLDILKKLDEGYDWQTPKLPSLFPLRANQWTQSLIGYEGGKDIPTTNLNEITVTAPRIENTKDDHKLLPSLHDMMRDSFKYQMMDILGLTSDMNPLKFFAFQQSQRKRPFLPIGLIGYEGGKDDDHIYDVGWMPQLTVTAKRKYIAGYDENGNPIYTENPQESMGYTPTDPHAEVQKSMQAIKDSTKPKYTDAFVKAAQLGIGLPTATAAAGPWIGGPLSIYQLYNLINNGTDKQSYKNGKDALPGYTTGEDRGFFNWLKNSLIGASVADAPAVATASGWHNEDGQWRQNRTAADEQLGENMSVLSTFSPTHPATAAIDWGIKKAASLLRLPVSKFVADAIDQSKDYTYTGNSESSKRLYKKIFGNGPLSYITGWTKTPPAGIEPSKTIQIPSWAIQSIENSTIPRMAKMRPELPAKQLSKWAKNKIGDTYTEFSDEAYRAAGEEDLGGLYDPAMDFVSIREGYKDFALLHELRHKLDHGLPLTPEEVKILKQAFNDDFLNLKNTIEKYKDMDLSKEMVTSIGDMRRVLLGDQVDWSVPIDKQNELIDAAREVDIIDALLNANGYTKNYYNALVDKYGQIPSEMFGFFRNAMKKIGMFGGVVGAKKLDNNYKHGKDSGIHIKPENRGKFTALKKRTGKSASWFKAHGTPAQKKMATFALNARKWKH